MEIITSITVIGLILSFFFGQLFRLSFNNFSFPLIDIFIVLFSIINLYQHLKTKNLQTKNIYFNYFLIFSWISLFINLVLNQYPPLKSIFYLIRLTSLISLLMYPPVVVFLGHQIKKFFVLSIIANIIFGLIQYIFWPDFTSFKSLNWDPHLYRLVSTYFDPTFTGLIYLLFLIYLVFSKKTFFNPTINKLLILFTYLATALTYSRSTLLSLLSVSIFVSIQKKVPKVFIGTLFLIIITIVLLPRAPGEGTKLERTSSIFAKIENYQEGLSVFGQSPIIGHGYNTLQYVRDAKNPSSHSTSGFDSSLLTILATTGIIGFCFFLLGIIKYFSGATSILKYFFIAIFVHSLFANSMLYPWIVIFLIII